MSDVASVCGSTYLAAGTNCDYTATHTVADGIVTLAGKRDPAQVSGCTSVQYIRVCFAGPSASPTVWVAV